VDWSQQIGRLDDAASPSTAYNRVIEGEKAAIGRSAS
jgi:hypothetical protein